MLLVDIDVLYKTVSILYKLDENAKICLSVIIKTICLTIEKLSDVIFAHFLPGHRTTVINDVSYRIMTTSNSAIFVKLN